MKILYYKDLSLAEALQLLEKRLNENNIKEEQNKMYEYLKKFSKLDVKKTQLIIDKLIKEINLPRSIAVQIVNILPSTVDELINLLPTDRYFSKEEVRKILKIIKE